MAATYGYQPYHSHQQQHQHQSLISSTRPAPPTVSQPSNFIHTEFSFESYIKTNLSLKLDNDQQLCPDFVANGSCPRSYHCPRRHVKPSPLNLLPPGSNSLRDPNKRTVCKHWLRGLCKKGDQCDYLHEYDLRRIPECRFYATFGFCNSGDDCLYLHVDKSIKRKECESYNRGFCPKGPECPKKHIRRVACPYYLCGFCPQGPSCKMGHIKSTPPSAASRSSSPIQTHRPLTAAEAFGGRGFGGGGGGGEDGFDGPPGRRDRAQPGRYGVMAGGGGGREGFAPGGNVPIPREGGFPGPPPPPPAGLAGAGQQRQANDFGPPGGAGRGRGGWRKDLNEVLCFKCGEYGHFANMCPNPNRPGNRGGLERGPGGSERKKFGGRPAPY